MHFVSNRIVGNVLVHGIEQCLPKIQVKSVRFVHFLKKKSKWKKKRFVHFHRQSTYVPFVTCPCVSFNLFLKCFTKHLWFFEHLWFLLFACMQFSCSFSSVTKKRTKNFVKCLKGNSVQRDYFPNINQAFRMEEILIFFQQYNKFSTN